MTERNNSKKLEICLSQEALLEIDLLIAEYNEPDINRSEVIEAILTWSMQSNLCHSEHIFDEIRRQKDTPSARDHKSE
jgi:hypothetical protein